MEALAKEKPDVVVALIDDCYGQLKPVLDNHLEWKVDLVVGSRCEGETQDITSATKYFSSGDGLSHYVSAAFTLGADGTRSLVATRKDVPETGAEDADIVTIRDRWQKKLDEDLGQTIGFTRTGFKENSDQLRTLVATALRDETKSDAVLLNRKGVRAALPAGAIKRSTIYDVIPFENAVLGVKVKGSTLIKFKANKEAFLLAPAKIDPEKEYSVVTTEYIYFGGDGLGLEEITPDIELTGQVWQTPVIEWLLKQKTDEKSPLEKQLK